MNYHTLTFYSPLDEVWVSFTPSLKGCMCHADSREASKSLIHEVTAEFAEGMKENGDLPDDDVDELVSTSPSVLDVAAYLSKQYYDGYIHDSRLTTMQLQKLAFFCQAYSLGWFNKPLYQESFYDYKDGPVSKTLYDVHKGKLIVTDDMFSSDHEFSPSERYVMDSILYAFGRYSGDELSDITHCDGPWKTVRGDMPVNEPDDKVIPISVIEKYYKELA